jgi:hypothetical protein
MALTDAETAELAELQTYVVNLRKIYYGGATSIMIDGVRTDLDPKQAWQALQKCQERINELTDVDSQRPVFSSVYLGGF